MISDQNRLSCLMNLCLRRIVLPVVLVWAFLGSVLADNPPAVQTFYIPIPEDDYLTVLNAIEDGQTWIAANLTPADPMYTYPHISVFSDNTIIYFDHRENGFDASISDPLNIYSVTNLGGTQIWGDDDPSNGIPPGFASDILDFGDVIRLENSVVSTNRAAINFDGGDKIASTKPIALTWAGWASGSQTLFAGALEVYDTIFWGTDYTIPVGEDISMDITTGVGEMFQYVGLSIMAGAGGATIQIDADADGVYETTNVLAEGEAYLQNGGVQVGARVISDAPVQMDMIAGDIYDGYESRFFRLLPTSLWSQSSTTPVSTPNGVNNEVTTVWLYNPTSSDIDVEYETRPGGTLTTSTLTIPGGMSGGYLQQVIPDGYGARFSNTNGSPFYALATIDSGGTGTSPTTGPGPNRTWDWGFTLVPEESLTRQVLVGLGIGRDPTSGTNPSENGAPIWVTPIGNGDTSVTIYVDYDSDPSTGAFQDPSGNFYDVSYTARELDQLKIYRTNSTDQSGILIYLLDDGVKLAAAWGEDPLTATAGQPGLDMGTGIPPLPEFVANKRSFLLIDEDNDGYISPGDVLQYRIVIDNTGRQPVTDLVAEDLLPDALMYMSNTTFFISSAGVTNVIADNVAPDSVFPLDEGGYTITNEASLPVQGTWQIGYDTRVVDFTNLPPGTVDLENQAVVGGVGLVTSNTVTTPIYARIGDFVWWDTDGDGYQAGSETGVNGVVVSLLTTNGTPVLDEIGSPITAVTTNDTFGNPGWYQLTGVLPGTYVVQFEPPAGYIFTTPDADGAGTAGSTNSNAAIPTGLTPAFTVEAGETLTTIDAGLIEASTIGDFVWWDADGDGLQDAEEVGLNGVTVNLLDTNGVAVLDANNNPITTVTADNGSGDPGYYLFEGLYPDDYIVEFVLPSNTAFAIQNADANGVSGGNNSDADTTTGRSDVFTLGVAEDLTRVDAGLLQAELILSKRVSQLSVSENASISYTVAISNAGPTLATNVVASEPLTNGITYVTNTVSQGNYDSGTGAWTVGTLAVGAVATLQLDVTVDAGTKGSSITNVSQITNAGVPDPITTNNVDDAVIYVSALRITKASDVAVSVQPGAVITYTIVVTNEGAVTHSDVIVSDMLPPGTSYVTNSVAAFLTPTPVDPPATTMVYSADSSFVVPAGVTSITAKAWGAGGGGGGGGSNPGAAGGGGAFAQATLSVTPGETISIEVGSGGDEGNPAGNAADGGGGGGSSALLRSGTNLVVAAGGGGGGGGDNSNPGAGAGGAGGAATGLVGGDASANTTGGGGGTQVAGGGAGASNNQGGQAGGLDQGGDGGGGNTANTVANAGAPNGGDAGQGQNNYGAGGGGGGGLYGGGGGGGASANQAGGGGGGGGSSFVTGTATTRTAGSGAAAANNADPDYVGGTGNGGNGGSAGASGTAGGDGLVVISYDPEPDVGVTGDPQTLASGWILESGATLTVTFDVLVDDPLDMSLWSITNTATVNSDLLPGPLTASVVDELIPVDLGILKVANPTVVNEGEAVAFTLTITNNSSLLDTTGVEVTDVLPAAFTFVSASATAGAYNSTTDVWTVGTLLKDDSEQLTINVTANNGFGGQYVTNVSTITASDLADTNALNNTDSAVVLIRGADLALTKTVDNPTPNEGNQVTYTIEVENLGPSDTTGITVFEPLTNGIVYVSDTPSQGSYDTNTSVWTVGALATGEMANLTITVQVENGTIGDTITNRSEITASDLPDPNPVNDSDTAILAISGLQVTKASDVSTFAFPGSNITYTIVVTNLGAVTYNGVEIVDPLPAGTTYVPDSLSLSGLPPVTNTVRDEFNAIAFTNNDGTVNWANDWQEIGESNGADGNAVRIQNLWGSDYALRVYNSSRGTWRQVDLSGATNATLTYDYRIVGFDGGEESFFSVSTNGGSSWITLDSWTANVGTTTSTNIDLTPYISPSTAISFSNAAVNGGGEGPQVDNVQIEFVSPGGNPGAPPNLASGITLSPGVAVTITYQVTVDNPSVLTQVVNTVSVTSDEIPVPIADTVTDPVPNADLGVVKVVDDATPEAGDTIVWSVTVTNNGPADTTGVELTDVLPSGVTYVTNSVTIGSYDDGTGIWTIGELLVGGSATMTVTTTVDPGAAGTTITNVATITGNDVSDPNPSNDEDDAEIVVVGVDIGVGKTVNPTVPFELEELVYTITVTNFGPDAATNVEVTDLLPAALSYVSHTVSQGSYVPGSGVWTIGTMTLLQDETLTITALVPDGVSGQSITNTVTVADVDQVDTNALNDSASVVVVPAEPPLLVSKSSDAVSALYGNDTVTYTITVTNDSVITQTGVDVIDPVPAGLAFVPGSVSVVGPLVTNKTFLDSFSSISYGNDNGDFSWSGNWIESEGDGAASGSTRVWTDSGRGPYVLEFGNASRTLARQADLSSYTNAQVSLLYRRDGLLDAGDFVELQASSTGTGGPWTTIATYAGPGTDGTYQNSTVDISGYISANTAIRFSSPAGNTPANKVWFDNVAITVPVRTNATFGGGSPPNLLEDQTLEPGESLVITYEMTVNDPVTTTQLCNEVTIQSDQMSNPVSDSVCDPAVIEYSSIGDRVWFDADSDGLQGVGETNNIANVPVLLLKIAGGVTNAITNTVTDANGLYQFDNLIAGDYRVRWDLTAVTSWNVRVTSYDQGAEDSLNSDGEIFYASTNGVGGLVDSRLISLAPGETNAFVDLGLTYALNTRAEISSVWGEWHDGAGVVVWRTSSEFGTAGFFVYRVDPVTGDETRVNDYLIVSAFNDAGARYEWVVPDVVQGEKRLYRIEEIEITGKKRDLGVHEVVFTVPDTRFLQRMSERYDVQSAKQDEIVVLSGPSERLTVRFDEPGIYGVSFDDIATGMGMTTQAVHSLASTNGFVLSAHDQDSIPYFVDTIDARILFYGQTNFNWYTRDAAYQLQLGAGTAMKLRDSEVAWGQSVFPAVKHFEEDVYPRDTTPRRPDDFFYWKYILSFNPSSLGAESFALDLTGYAGGDVVLTVGLIGGNKTDKTPDHSATLYLNGTPIGNATFDGLDSTNATFYVPEAVVTDGTNTLTIEAGLLYDGHSSFIFVDEVVATFNRQLSPEAGMMHVTTSPDAPVYVTGFTRPVALSVADPANPIALSMMPIPIVLSPTSDSKIRPLAEGSQQVTSWIAVSKNETFVLADSDRIPMLPPEAAVGSSWLTATTNRIDYLIITSRTLEPTAELLADYRRQQGLRVGVTSFEDISDIFGKGLRSPETIRWMLAYARANWDVSPWMVVLAGNGHYDYVGTIPGSGENHVPPLLHSNLDGLFASDGLFVDYTNDEIPDIAIGRLPARTSAELQAMIDKIQRYETSFGSVWQNNVTLIADQMDAAGDFAAFSEELATQTAGGITVDRIYLDSISDAEAKTNLLSTIDAGVGFVYFTGHGGRDSLSEVLEGSDVNTMNNTNPTILVALSCLAGRFEAPGIDSLGVQLMRRDGGGTVAVLGPSGLSFHEPAATLGEALYENLLVAPVGYLGAAWIKARQTAVADGKGESTRGMYNLLGDPALRIGGVQQMNAEASTFEQWRWSYYSPSELVAQGDVENLSSPEVRAAFRAYALGLDPSGATGTQGMLMIPQQDPSDTISVIWKRRYNASDLQYQLRVSDNLFDWEDISVRADTISHGVAPDGEMEQMETRIPREALNARLFIRLEVAPTP
jgi:uncharacterized repeat protein (TIGR01451 family)